MSNRLASLWPLLLILLVGCTLRFTHLGDWSLSNDELSGLNRVSPDSFSEMIDYGVRSEGHPAGYHTFLYTWTRLISDNTETLRIPFAIAGCLSLLLLYLLAERWFNRRAAFVATALWASLQFPLLYSQLARPYALASFAVLLMAYAWTKWIYDQRKGFAYLYLLAAVLCLYLHYFSFMLAGLFAVAGLFLIPSPKRKFYLLIQILLALSFVPHIGLFFDQLAQGGIGEWLDPPGPWFFFEHLFYVFNESWFVLIPVCGLIVYGVFKQNQPAVGWSFRKLALLFFMVPITVGFLYSILRAPVVQHSTLLFSAPFLLLFASSFVPELPVKQGSWLLLLLVGLGSTLIEKSHYSTPHFGEFEGVARKLQAWEQEVGADNILVVGSYNHRYYLDYYYRNLDREPNLIMSQMPHGEAQGELAALLQESSKIYVALVWSSSYLPPEAELLIQHHFSKVKERALWFNAKAVLFERSAEKGRLNREIRMFYTVFEPDAAHWKVNSSPDDSLKSVEVMSVKQEYSNTFEAPLAEIYNGNQSGIHALGQVEFEMEQGATAQLVLSFHKGDETVGWHSARLEHFQKNRGWNSVLIDRPLPDDQPVDRIKLYVWKTSTSSIKLRKSQFTLRQPSELNPYEQKHFSRQYFDR